MKGAVFISYGMGGAYIETWNSGLRLLVARCKQIGLETFASPYDWYDVEAIVAQIGKLPAGIPVGVGGASLGDDEAPDIATRVKQRHLHPIRYLFGFQDSEYGVNVPVPSNIDFATNIYNPAWWQTFGLGSRKWVKAQGNTHTLLENIPIYASHPDDWGVAQDIVFSRIHKHMGV